MASVRELRQQPGTKLILPAGFLTDTSVPRVFDSIDDPTTLGVTPAIGDVWNQCGPTTPPPPKTLGTIGVIGDSLTKMNGNGPNLIVNALVGGGADGSKIQVDGVYGMKTWAVSGTPVNSTQQIIDGWRASGFDPQTWIFALGINDQFASSSTPPFGFDSIRGNAIQTVYDYVMAGGRTDYQIYWIGFDFYQTTYSRYPEAAAFDATMQYFVNKYSNFKAASIQKYYLPFRSDPGFSAWWVYPTDQLHNTDLGFQVLRAPFYQEALTGGAYARPSGAGFTRFEDAGTTDVRTALHGVAANTNMTFPAGTFTFSGFNDPQGSVDGIRTTKASAGISGAGMSATVFEMVPNTAAYTAPTGTGTTNQAYLIDNFTDGPAKPQQIYQGFTLRGTTQSATPYYNGMRVAYAINPIIRNVYFDACAPGYQNFPPGETFGFTSYHTSGVLVQDCMFDGKGGGASMLASNYDTNVTWRNCRVFSSTGHNVGMPTHYGTNGITTYNVMAHNGHTGMNHEECGTGPIRHYNPDLAIDRGSTPNGFHMQFASTAGTGDNDDIEIHWDGVPAPTVDVFPGANGAFVFRIPDVYSSTMGSGEAQVSMPKVFLNGKRLTVIDIPVNKSIAGTYGSNVDPTAVCFRFHQ